MRWFQPMFSRRGRPTAARRPVLEGMEQRALLATAEFAPNGDLVIEGDNFADTVTVTENPVIPGAVTVTDENGAVGNFTSIDQIRFYGRGGNDTFVNNSDIPVEAWGQDGHDTLTGGSADDGLHGGTGDDYLYGRDGNDRLNDDTAPPTQESFFLGGGSDRMYGGPGDDVIWGGQGVDRLYGDDTYAFGGDANEADDGDDEIHGGEPFANFVDSRDYLYGEGGDDSLRGDDGDDYLYGHGGVDLLRGEIGNDRLYGGNDADVLISESGTDQLHGEGGNDSLYARLSATNTLVWGGAGADRIFYDMLVHQGGAVGQVANFDLQDFDQDEGDLLLPYIIIVG